MSDTTDQFSNRFHLLDTKQISFLLLLIMLTLNPDGTFSYTPGWSLDWTVQLQLQLAIVGLGVAYGTSHSQEPELMGDPAFISMARGLELLGAQSTDMVQIGASVSLLPLYIPLDVMLSYRKVVDGYNAIVFDDYVQLTLKGYIPVNFFFE